MATLQIRVDDDTKKKADVLFTGLGLDTPTAIRIFLAAAIDNGGIPFVIQKRKISQDLAEAIEDTRNRTNLSKPYKTATEAIGAMLEGE